MSALPKIGGLLTETDPEPVVWVNPNSRSPLLLVCEHAGQAIPVALGDLGLPAGAIDAHIGWDIGAFEVARRLADLLDAPLVAQRYSRLVIDCNRPPNSPSAMPEVSDGIAVPGNRSLTPDMRRVRRQAIFAPFAAAVEAGFAQEPRSLAISIHSFTPSMCDGRPRPWHAGFLARRDMDTSRRMMDRISRRAPELVMALNEPYRVEDETDWFIPVQCEPRGIHHSLVEIRNDLIRTPEGQEAWARHLASAIRPLLQADSLPPLAPTHDQSFPT